MAPQSSTCAVCGKSIQNKASIKRHERYCRKRVTQPVPPRRKSCLACIRAKTRCDFQTAGCEPCQRKGRECIYSSDSLSSSDGVSGFSVAHLSITNLPSDSPEASQDIPSEIIESSSRLLQPRQRERVSTKSITRLMSQVVFSYPERKMSETSYPPFIHHLAFVRLPMSPNDPIFICQDICHRFTACDPTVWDAITTEQDRIYEQRASYDKWSHLSSAQAITIYLLMLIPKCESVLPFYPNLPITLLFTLGTIFAHLHQIHPGYLTVEENNGGTPTWDDWIFAESKLRTATVYFILSLHFNVDYGLPCERVGDNLFEDVDVPSPKTLWEARHERLWSEDFHLTSEPGEARLKYRDLVKLNKRDSANESPNRSREDEFRLEARVEKWHKGMDELGMLVALCSTMG